MRQIPQYDAVVVGAGASGLMAALSIARQGGRALLVERMKRPGKKLLATGNGKCNMTNMNMAGDCYRGSAQSLAYSLLAGMPPQKLRRLFYGLGLATVERDGYVYPVTEQAKTVVSILLGALEQNSVPIHTGETVQEIIPPKKKKPGMYLVRTDKGSYAAPFVVAAAGGKSYPKLGGSGSGYRLLRELGIRVEDPLPALTAFTSSRKMFRTLAGVRTKGELFLAADGKPLGKRRGEIQLTDYGISGIPVLELSRYGVEAIEKGEKTEAIFDFFPSYSFSELRKTIRDFRDLKEDPAAVLSGLVHEKWIPVLLAEVGFLGQGKPGKMRAGASLPEERWNRLASLLKAYPIPLDGYRGFDYAQVCQGGVASFELTGQLECRKYPGLFAVGELVDVDGTCGGYNLHWAFASGYLAGEEIGRRCAKKISAHPERNRKQSYDPHITA